MQIPRLDSVDIMGILNVTPDSFSDGNSLFTDNTVDATKVYQQARLMLSNGATILDLGGESSGPKSQDISLEEERNRVIPALQAILPLKNDFAFDISIDTYKAPIAQEALGLGATMINDVTALRGDSTLAKVVAEANCKIILMYAKDPTARTTRDPKEYTDVIVTIKEFFDRQIAYAQEQGISKNQMILDPGMGAFVSSIPKYSYEILERLEELATYNLPILVGTSRKSMLPFPLQERLIPSVTTSLFAAINGANILRVHDVKEHYQALHSFSY